MLMCEVALVVVLLMGGAWMTGLFVGGVLGFDVYQLVVKKAQRIDVTEIFRVMKERRRILIKKLVVCLLLFMYVLYRFVEIMVLSLVSTSGRAEASNILKQAAASLH